MMDQIRVIGTTDDGIDPADDTPDIIVLDGGDAVVQPPRSRLKLFRRVALVTGALLVLLLAYLTLTAPLSKSLKPLTAPSITLLTVEGKPIARRGSVTDAPVRAQDLPRHVPGAFLAIEDRRFYRHLGVDPWGIARAAGRNLASGGVVEGGSTISQQLAKLAFLSSDQTAGRKIQEAIMAVWLETWLTKDEILSRYLSSVYFGDNVYGLRAAASHYFSRKPEELSPEQAAMLAGLVKAPSTLAPTKNLKGARARGKIVEAAMARAGYLTAAQAEALPTVKLTRGAAKDVPTGTYFADWLFANELADLDHAYGEQRIRTTLEDTLQRQAVAAIRSVGTAGAEVALVSMRQDGRVVAMVGGKSYRRSPFNRATQAKRQAGSTFKAFVYLAAMRAGYSPGDMIEDTPVRVGNWSPQNYESKYRGPITLRDAFAFSSNVAAVRLSEKVGRQNVIRAARDLGITSELEEGPTLPLGTSTVSLLEMTSAFSGFSAGAYPVKPHGLPGTEAAETTPFDGPTRDKMLQLLAAVTTQGTGRAAALPVQSFGKTGTSQNSRDAYFIGFAGDLITGVWIGKDDNSPVGDATGGGIPANIWRAFMSKAVQASPAAPTAGLIEDVVPADEAALSAPLTDIYTGYDVEAAPAGEAIYYPGDPAAPAAGEDLPAAAADEGLPAEDGPDAPERDVPTLAAPPPPPGPAEEGEEEEPPPEEE
jgi:penicillin-binding protein 1A